MSEVTYVTWADLPQVDMLPGVRRRVLGGDNLMSVQVTLEKGAVVPEHSHHHEQISHVLSGKLDFTVGGQRKLLGPGQAVLIPSNVLHIATALEDSVVVDVFSPIREDFLGE
jgi:quercetin dioxygenase-like cupin family protein